MKHVGNPSEEKLTSLRTQLSSLNNIEQTYTSGLIEGKIGAENIYDTFLSGEFGTKQREVDARGRTLSEEIVSSPKMGSDLYTSLDLASHQAAFSAMQGRRGAIVAVDIQTGSIVTLFSPQPFLRINCQMEFPKMNLRLSLKVLINLFLIGQCVDAILLHRQSSLQLQFMA